MRFGWMIMLILAQALAAMALPVAEQGRPAAEIVLAANADPRERLAAGELQVWFRAVSGATLPLLALPSDEANTKLFVGRSWAGDFAADLAELEGSDGFAVRQKGRAVHVFGARPAGTLFGAWRFLEENTDIVWARPNPDFGTVFSSNANVSLVRMDFREKPAFQFRSWSMPGGVSNETTHLWQARLGCNGQYPSRMTTQAYLDRVIGRPMKVGGGFMYGFLGGYKESRPDFFPFVDGRRVLSNHAQPCFTNPDAVAALIKEARKLLADAPEETLILDCGNEDTWRCCECPECLKPIRLPDGTELAPKSPSAEKDPLFRSTQMYLFLNKVAENLAPDYPDLKIMTLAYIFAAEPPRVKVHPSILALFAPYPTCNMRFPIRESGPGEPGSWATRFEAWRRHPTLAFYEYLGVGYFNAMADTAAENLRDLRKAGGYGINSEALQDLDTTMEGIGLFSRSWDVNAMEMWVISRLMWDPDRDVAALRREYIRRAYREAAPPMEGFFAILHKNWHDRSLKHVESCHSGPGGVFKRYFTDTGDEKKARALLVEAERVAAHPNSKRLIGRILKQFDAWAGEQNRLAVPRLSEAAVAGEEFGSPHWEKARPIDDFKLSRHYTNPAAARFGTEVRMMRDDSNLVVRVVAADPEPAQARVQPPGADETFPAGDHVELFFKGQGGVRLFAIGPNGNRYDAKSWDRRWQSGWRVKTRLGERSWEALAVIPLSDLGTNAGVSAVFARIYDHGEPVPEESTYRGVVANGEHGWSPLDFE